MPGNACWIRNLHDELKIWQIGLTVIRLRLVKFSWIGICLFDQKGIFRLEQNNSRFRSKGDL